MVAGMLIFSGAVTVDLGIFLSFCTSVVLFASIYLLPSAGRPVGW